ncbi:HNH endonuclease [Natronoarchaeum rubrum]|uniref:HNH endonuclease n=1 Tax=Natronoarchaeum rubrum TaxID=755311 RepID=UPI0035C1C76A
MSSIEALHDRYRSFISDQRWRRDNDTRSEVSECISELVAEHLDENANHREEISFIFESFEDRVHPELVADAIDCSISYVRRFDYNPESGRAFERKWSKQNQNSKVSPGQRDRILRRDNNRCPRCQTSSPLEVHHIIPVSRGGTKDDGNLVTLCENCHTAAHGGSKTTSDTVYSDKEGFRDWVTAEPHPAETVVGQSSLSDYRE